ncbi:MAG: hypothetical protein ACE5IB_07405 [Candidatus Geothermarchaeales archaeon]
MQQLHTYLVGALPGSRRETTDSIAIVMENHGKTPGELELFLSSLLGYKSLRIANLSLLSRIAATKHMKENLLDYDGSTTYQAMKELGLRYILSYDEDFDDLEGIERVEPSQEL